MPLEGKRWLQRDIAKLLWDNGWLNAENLTKMVAVVLAESAGFEQAWGQNAPTPQFPNGTVDWGLFQLNDQGRTGTALAGFKAMAFDPLKAVVTARALYVDRAFQPWVAYANQSYKGYLPEACYGVHNFLREHFDLAPI